MNSAYYWQFCFILHVRVPALVSVTGPLDTNICVKQCRLSCQFPLARASSAVASVCRGT